MAVRSGTWKLTALALCLALLCGCEFSFFNPEAAMRAPHATGETQEIQRALEEAVGKDIVLKYPRTGHKRSAFLMHDIDGDSVEEVFAFYQRRDEMGVTRMHLLRKEVDQWITVQDMAPAGTNLINIEFADLDGNGIDEVVTGWGTVNSTENLLCIYEFYKDRLIQRAREKYSQYFLFDFNYTGKKEVGIVYLNTSTRNAVMNVLDFSEEMTVLGSVALDGSASGYLDVQAARLDNGNTAIYIDTFNGPNETATEVVIYNGKEFYNLFLDTQTMSTILTRRSWVAQVQDINNDDKLDIPFSVTLPHDVLSGLPQQYLTRWQTYSGEGYNIVLDAWYCFQDHYYLVFDKRWVSDVTVRYYEEEHLAVFCEWDSFAGAAGEELLRIQMLSKDQWESDPPPDFNIITRTEDVVYAAKISDSKSKNAITARQLLDSFYLVLNT